MNWSICSFISLDLRWLWIFIEREAVDWWGFR